MATSDEMVTSLVMDEIPVKLRCASCNKLAVNAFRMPCCDQSICETCQSSLPQACPVCLHEPVKADDCRPNKALRTTIKVFLRKKGIEREAALKKESLDKPVASPAEPPLSQGLGTSVFGDGKPNGVVAEIPSGIQNKIEPRNDPSTDAHQASHLEDQVDIPRPSIESANDGSHRDGSHDKSADVNGVQEQTITSAPHLDRGQHNEDSTHRNGQWGANLGAGSLLNNNGIGLNAMNSGFPAMDFNANGDFGQMMQFMPNGMQTGNMDAFSNMMMMPGMGMDPMGMTQGMYGGLGSQGMGMNGMNVGMGFNAGQGAYGGYYGQPAAWDAGQDKFNPNAFGGHSIGMSGDFGGNTGYGGYNMPQHQGNFNQIHHQYQNNDFQNGYNGQGFHTRGRGRGRGYYNAGRGRGGHNQVNAGNQSNYEPFHHQIPPPVAKPDPIHQQNISGAERAQDLGADVVDGAEKAPEAHIDPDEKANVQLNKDLEPGGLDDFADANQTIVLTGGVLENNTFSRAEPSTKDSIHDEKDKTDPEPGSESILLHRTSRTPEKQDQTSPIETFISDDVEEANPNIIPNSISASNSTAMGPPPQPIPVGPAAQHSGDPFQEYGSRGRGSGRGYFRGSSEYRGALRGRGSSLHSNPSTAPAVTPPQPVAMEKIVIAPAEPKGLGVEGAPKAPKALREGLPNTSIRGGRGFSIVGRAANGAQAHTNGHARSRSPSPARSRSRSRHDSNRHRSHRHRSISSSNVSDREPRRDRQRRHSRKHGDDDHDRSQTINGPHVQEDPPEDPVRRSSHKSHRDHNKEKDPGRSGHRSRRSHREKSRERAEGETRGGRRRSKSAEDGISRTNRLEESQPLSPTKGHRKEKPEEASQSFRKKRDREEEDRHRERKRSRRARSSEANDQDTSRRTRHVKRNDIEKTKQAHDPSSSSLLKISDRTAEKTKPAPSPINIKPEMDHHTMEREARNRERLLKELQRREAMEGKGTANNGQRREGGGKIKTSDGRGGGGTSSSSRRMSYKYEDEESNEARASRVEHEREAGRWR